METMLKAFVPTVPRLEDLSKRLKETRLYLPDDMRENDMISVLILSYFGGRFKNVFFEMGDWGGLMGLTGIVEGWKADFFFKIWDKKLWGPTLCREIVDKLRQLFDEYRLERISLYTPDEHMGRFALKHGFEHEGILYKNFRWNGEFFDTICMAMTRR